MTSTDRFWAVCYLTLILFVLSAGSAQSQCDSDCYYHSYECVGYSLCEEVDHNYGTRYFGSPCYFCDVGDCDFYVDGPLSCFYCYTDSWKLGCYLYV